MPEDSPLIDEREETFAREFALNGNATQAWMVATGKTSNCANVNGCKWATKTRIAARIGWFKSEAAKISQEKAGIALLTLIEKRELLAEIARDGEKDSDRINAIKADNDLASHGSEASAYDALSQAATAALDRIFGPPA